MRKRGGQTATKYNLRKLLGGSLGAIAVMVIMTLSPIASASNHPAIFKNAAPYSSEQNTLSGCSKGKVAKPTISVLTGFGKAAMSGKAKTCPGSKGGSSIQSSFNGFTQLGIIQTVKLTAPKTNVNMTWNITGVGSTMAVGTLVHCPSQNYSFSYFTGSTWVFYNSTNSYCAADSYWEIYAFPYVYDTTSGTYTYSSGFTYMQNESGNYYSKYSYTYNYSNSSYTNSTFAGTFNHSYGNSAITHISWGPSWNVAGSWSTGDKLIIYSELYIFAYASITYETHGKAATSFAATGALGHVDLRSITLT